MGTIVQSIARLKRSWTVYVNSTLALLIPLLAMAEQQFHLLKGVLGEKWWPIAFFALAVVNVALRVKTEAKHMKLQES